MILRNRRTALRAVLIFVASVLVALITSSNDKSQAAYSDMDIYLNDIYDQYISLEENDPVTGKGNKTPSFRFLHYTESGNPSGSVVIRNITTTNKPRCTDFIIDVAPVSDGISAGLGWPDGMSNIGNPIDIDEGSTSRCENTENGFILRNLPGYSSSNRFPGHRVAAIRLSLVADKPSVFLDVRNRYDYPNDRLSYVGVNTTVAEKNANQLYSSNGVSLSIPQSSIVGNRSTISQRFAPPCNTNGATAHVWWKDADSNTPANNGKEVKYYLREYKNGYNNGYKTLASDDASGDGQAHGVNFTPLAGSKYEIVFTGVLQRGSDPANTIKVWAPYDSASAYVDCPKQEPPPCQGSWSYNVSDNSVYKYSFFDRQPSVINPSPVDKSSGASREWATTSGATNLKTDYHNSDDGNYSTSLPNEIQYLGGYVLIERWHYYDSNGNGSRDRMDYGRTHAVLPKCATASCVNPVSIRNMIPGSNNGVQAGQNFELEVDISGTNLPGYLNSQPLSIIIDNASTSSNWHGAMVPLTEGLGTANFPNTNRTGSVTLYMPGDLVARGVSMYIGYPNLYSGRVSANCGTTVNPYHWFDTTANPSIALTADSENPTQVTASATISRNGGQIDAPINSANLRITRNGNTEGTPTNVAGSPWSVAGTATVPQSQLNVPAGVRSLGWNVGDRICALLEYTYKSGWLGPGNSVAQPTSSGPIEGGCDQITNRPYISAYGGDVAAGGGGLGLPCSSSGSIGAYFKSAGSGAQYAAYAMESISGFKSAFLRDASYPTAPRSPNDLTFGNTPSLGQYKLVDCATDFYNVDQYEDGDSRKNTAIPGSISAAGLPDGGQSVRTGNLTLNGGGFTGKHSIFVDRDVFITGNIAYTSTSWANIAEIPYFNLVVRGNIYISQDVTQLDGRYIAQPRSATEGGHIYTCAYAGGGNAGQPVPTNPGSELWNQCGGGTNSRRLVINGQFVARTVHFLRTINTLSDGVGRETVANSRAGEVFNLSPEIFLGQPATRPKSTSTSGEYQNITVLPPIL